MTTPPPAEPIRRLTPASLSRRLRDAGFGVQVMAYHEAGKSVPDRACVGHHGHDRALIREWLTTHGLLVAEFGEAVFDVTVPIEVP